MDLETKASCAAVIATRNRAPVLARTLERLRALPERPEIVVVDNASSDETSAVCRFFNVDRYLRFHRNAGAYARTIGARCADAPFIAFCDDDTTWLPGSITTGLKAMQGNAKLAVLNARVLVYGQFVDPACQAMDRKASEMPPIVYFMAGAALMRRSAFLACGGYHRRYHIGAEESLLALDLAREGWELRYCPKMTVRHDPASEAREPVERRRYVLRNRLWTAWLRHRSGSAWRQSMHYLRASLTDRVVREATLEALRGWRWIAQERRPIDSAMQRLVDRHFSLDA